MLEEERGCATDILSSVSGSEQAGMDRASHTWLEMAAAIPGWDLEG